jgi:phosphoesterase RecJ-like protein
MCAVMHRMSAERKQMKIIEELKGAKKIAIGGHIRPDGDCVGSCMAMYLFLKKALPGAEISVYLEKPADIFACIKGFDEIKTQITDGAEADAFIVLDCADDRLGFSRPLFESARRRINIDHHITNPGCGNTSLVVPGASSTSELVYGVIDHKLMDADVAKALYIGIIHDTGVFQYSNTSPETMRIAADLISYGFDFPKLIDETFYEKTYVQTQILGRALLESIMFMDGRCIVSMVSRETMRFYHVEQKDLDGIVSQLRQIKGVDCAIFMCETGVMEYKVSMRSSDNIDVAKIAMLFGGGGHKKAAGCTMNGTYHDSINNLSLHIEKQLQGLE